MEMDIFAEKVRVAVKKKLGKDYKVNQTTARKNNGVCMEGIMIREKGGNVSPAIYLDAFLAAYRQGFPFQAVVDRIVQVYQENKVGSTIDMEFFRDFDAVRDRICYRLIGTEMNGELLEEVPHMEFLDLAICFYYAYQDDGFGEGSILVHNSHVKMWGTNTVELYRLAKENTSRLFPEKYGTISEMLGWSQGTTSEAKEDGGIEGEGLFGGIPMVVLTNSKRVNGASCILYPGVMEEMAGVMGGDYYIIPSSLHEVILLPCSIGMPIDFLEEMISEVNCAEVEPEEVLSNSLYRYNVEDKVVELVKGLFHAQLEGV